MKNIEEMADNCSEVYSECARADFENVLQIMIEKANATESLTSTQSDQSDEKDVILKDNLKNVSSPAKASRKRRRKDNCKDDRQKNTYIIKLFDRSVDLATFPEDTSLYPVCRSWMKNDPCRRNALKRIHQDRYKTSRLNDSARSDSDEEDTSPGCLTEIPPPDVPWNNILLDGSYCSPRIPSPVQRFNQSSIDNYLILQQPAPEPEKLLLDHLRHWKAVREKWKLKSVENERRYETGIQKLQQIFQRSSLFSTQSSQQA